jgi:hypothetical protein
MDQKEKKVGDILRHRQVNIDSSEIWKSIEDALPRKKRKVAAIWWFGLLLFPLVTLSYYLAVSVDQSEKEGAPKTELVGSEIPVNSINLENVVVRNVGESPVKSNQSSDLVESKISEDVSEKTEDVKFRNYELSKVLQYELRKGGIVVKETRINRGKEMTSAINLKKVDEEDLSQSNLLLPLAILVKEAANDLLLPNQSAEELGMKVSSKLTPRLCCDGPKYSLVFIAGGNQSFDQITGIRDREVGLYGGSFDGRFDIGLKKRWSLSLGMSYDRMVSRYERKGVSTLQREGRGISEITINALGQTNVVDGRIIETVYKENQIQWHRRHQSLDFDLALSKRFTVSQNLGINLFGGMSYNIMTRSKGFGYEVGETESIEKFDRDPGFYLKRTGFKPKTGFELSYTFGRLEILLNTNYEWNLRPINTQNDFYQIKHSQTGIQLGTRYYLNGNKN